MKKIYFPIAFVVIFLFVFQISAQAVSITARVSSISETSAKVYVSGWTLERGQSVTLLRSSGADAPTQIQVGNASGWTDSINQLGKTYSYSAQIKNSDGSVAETSDSVSLNLSVRPGTIVKGVGWGAMDSAGIGWISINSSSREDSKSPVHSSSISYGVYADTDGLLHGAMWAGHKTSPNVGYGWLSFNKEDLAGCPDGTCEARIGSNGEIYGWARFINTKEADSWSGWVRLRTDGSHGLCFGDPSGNFVKINEGTKDEQVYYSGSSCKGNGGAQFSVLTGAAWAGDDIGGWILFASSSKALINPSSTAAQLLVQPRGPHRVAIRDTMNFWANRIVDWFVDGDRGGNDMYGRVLPNSSGAWQNVTYSAPQILPANPDTEIMASTTEPINPAVASESIKIVRPYDISCIPEGQTSIRIVITKNYPKITDNQNYPLHTVQLFGGKSTPPTKEIASSTNAMSSFVHTNLDERKTYYYKLITKFKSDNYTVENPIISCTTGSTPAPILSVTSLNAYANNSHTIVVNWKDGSKATTPYEFEVQRMRVTPDKDLQISFEPKSATEATLSWKNKTLWVPYSQQILRKTGNEEFQVIPGGMPGWSEDVPPRTAQDYSVTDKDVQAGLTYVYKVKICGLMNLDGTYSTPLRGGTNKPSEVCVESQEFSYTHSWSGGGEPQAKATQLQKVTASLLNVMQGAVKTIKNAAVSLSDSIADIWGKTSRGIASLFTKNDSARAQVGGPALDNYFESIAITKNPAYIDAELISGTVYMYRVSILVSGGLEPVWSDMRSAKTLDNDEGPVISEKRSICMRNSFCDSSFGAFQTRDLSESSEQQCNTNKDCANVGRSDQGYQER